MPDKETEERMEHCRRMAAKAQANAWTSGADFRESWNTIAESWHALARQLQHDAAPIRWSASTAEQTRETMDSMHLETREAHERGEKRS